MPVASVKVKMSHAMRWGNRRMDFANRAIPPITRATEAGARDGVRTTGGEERKSEVEGGCVQPMIHEPTTKEEETRRKNDATTAAAAKLGAERTAMQPSELRV